jgi:hypothetical protein
VITLAVAAPGLAIDFRLFPVDTPSTGLPSGRGALQLGRGPADGITTSLDHISSLIDEFIQSHPQLTATFLEPPAENIEPFLALVRNRFPRVRAQVALIRDPFAFIRRPITLIGRYVPRIGDPFALIRRPITPIGH